MLNIVQNFSIPEYNGKTPEETLLIDMFVETLYDLIARYDDVVKEQDPDMKVSVEVLLLNRIVCTTTKQNILYYF